MTPQVLLIDDDDAMRISMAQTMDLEGIRVISTNGLSQARRAIRANFAGVILSDIRMPVDDGFAVLEYVQSVDPDLPVIMLTGEADVPMALRSIKEGAYDFLEKPCPSEHLLSVLDRAMGYRNLILQKRRLEYKAMRNDPAAINFPGFSNVSKKLQNNLRQLGAGHNHVYISGAEGVGKKLAAFTLHNLGQEGAKFLGFNFNNAHKQLSSVSLPSGIVNFSIKSADLASDTDLDWLVGQTMQNPELRLLMSGQSMLKDMANNHDFFNALNFVELNIPSLRARQKDLPVIFEQTLRQLVRNQNMDMPEIGEDIYARIAAQAWEGNLTELRLYAQDFLSQMGDNTSSQNPLTLAQKLDNYEELVLREELKRSKGNASRTAAQLGMPRKTFYDRLARYNIKPKEYKT